MKKSLILVIIVSFLSGCSTTPLSLNEIKDVPGERIFGYQNKVDNYANLVLIRDKGLVGSGCYINVFINGQEVAELETRERVSLYAPSGNIIIGSSLQGSGLCSFNPPRREREFSFKDGERKVFRLSIDQNGNTDITPTTLY
ncbi:MULTISPECIES: hypothetical protein [unclassified Gilliamella]|uniref:hypothetical protein n=1 Tax=unclassified Gilliamella TaxID=2685620 RepID=UPI001309F2DB|nr:MULTISPECIES: hypothetical protein [unclassified Gilliamella]MWP48524.1 hypothetical protein [Gilliamella sp. Lep-s35]MWP68586.1 hypothetical protein [Gilliamella sp. Lep-s5]MWP76746.1 hypothetical protein [Gilliamella sp. Lep-s21]